MSWMDSWSRPSKSSATPPPLYLTQGDTVPYCHSCGRVIGQRKTHASQEVKYCSARCRNTKLKPIDRRIESVFASLLEGAAPESLKEGKQAETIGENEMKSKEVGVQKKGKKKTVKGDPRIIVECSTVEDIVFPRPKDPSKVFGRRKNRAARGVVENPEDWRSVDMVDDANANPTSTATPTEAATVSDESALSDSDSEGGVPVDSKPRYGYGGGKIRPPQALNDVNGSIGGEKGRAERSEETDEMKEKRIVGQRRAEEREMVRKAARRGCAFGFTTNDGGGEKRKCEAIMKGVVVEASFAKGEWGVRWREKT